MPRTLYSVINFVRVFFKLKPSEPSWAMMPNALDQNRFSRNIQWTQQANQDEDLSPAVEHSPEPFSPMDEQMLRQIDDAEDLPLAEQDGEARVVEADLASVRGFPGSRSASTRSVRVDAPQAILKGSPKILGWEVDEEGEQTAWEMLMGDAMSSTVFEPVDDVAEEPPVPPQTKREMYKTYLEHWNEEGVALVWQVVPSLKGFHSWILQPKIMGQAPSVLHVGVDMSTDTEDLVTEAHTEAGTQTIIKEYAEMEVQTDEIEIPLSLPLPKPEAEDTIFSLQSPIDADVPGVLTQGFTMEPDTISRPDTPSRILRMTQSRRASFSSQTSATKAPTTNTRADSPSRTAVRLSSSRASSVRSLTLKRTPSNKSTAPPGSFGPVPVKESESIPPLPAVSSEPTTIEPAPAPVPLETTTERLYGVMRRFSRQNSVLGSWR